MKATESEAFEEQLVSLLPKMRAWAIRLTRDASAADDLVQDVVMRALLGRHNFVPGTYFSAWIHRIMVNSFISTMRARRELVDIQELPDASVEPEQDKKLDLDRVSVEFMRLPKRQREALGQIAIEQRSYEDVSKLFGCPIGTLKSWVHRARITLRTRLEGTQHAAA